MPAPTTLLTFAWGQDKKKTKQNKMNKKQIIGYNIYVKGLLEDQDSISAKDLNYWISVWQTLHIDMINDAPEMDDIMKCYAKECLVMNNKLVVLKNIRMDERADV